MAWAEDTGIYRETGDMWAEKDGIWAKLKGGVDIPTVPADTPIGTSIEGGYFAGTISIGGINYALITSSGGGVVERSVAWSPVSTYEGVEDTVDGLQNTRTILSNSAAESFPAAEFCASRSIGGYDDWYFPAKDELAAIYANNAALPVGARLSASYTYLTSTEFNAQGSLVYGLRVSDSLMSGWGKTTVYRAHPIRRVLLG